MMKKSKGCNIYSTQRQQTDAIVVGQNVSDTDTIRPFWVKSPDFSYAKKK